MTRKNIKKRAADICRQNTELGIFAAAVPGALCALAGLFAPLAQGGFLFGKNKVFLDLARQGEGQLEGIFDGFKSKEKYTKGLLLHVVKSLYITVGTCLLLVPGIIVWLRFLFAELIMADEENISVLDALNKSRYLTKDHMGEVFGFVMSFIGWFLLGIIPIFGWVLMAVYVIPYFKTALAAYYYTMQDEAIRAAERKAKFRYPGGTPTRKRLDAGAAATQQQLDQQQQYARQQAYMQQQAYYGYQQPAQPQNEQQ